MRALGANPSMTQRQKQQLLDDANEIVVPSTRSAGGTGFLSGDMVRVRDRMAADEASKPEAARPKTAEQIAGDYYYSLHLQKLEKEKADKQAALAARQKREADEKAARERKIQQGQHAFLENAVLHEASDLDADEAQLFWGRLASAGKMLDIEFAAIVSESIRSSRKV